MYIVAHRGAEDLELENTMAAFRAAPPADAFELDVHASLDNQLVVIHDRTAARVAAPDSPHRDSPIASLTLEEIRQIRLSNGEGVPTLQEVLDATTLPIQVEIKAPGAVTPLAQLFRDQPEQLGRILFICFIDAALVELIDRLPDARVGVLRAEGLDDRSVLDELPAKNLAAFLPYWKLVTPELVTDMHSRGIKVGCWTIRDEEALLTVEAAGVDFATASDPGRFRPGSVEEEPLRW
ncbi:MAG: glycerophosphodiester phosphodiesterase [Corynebacterium sp.]|nr:glycerophosphodiester phosphodiesterase [Corynebacterium sp.]